MELKIFSGEKFIRDKKRYIIFSLVFISIFTISIFYNNIVGIILMFFLLGAYIYYGIINIQETTMKMTENGLIVGEKILSWNDIKGFCLEIEQKTKQIKNIVLVSPKGHSIYTISDNYENIKNFLQKLEKLIPMLPDFPQTFREKVSRKMKL